MKFSVNMALIITLKVRKNIDLEKQQEKGEVKLATQSFKG